MREQDEQFFQLMQKMGSEESPGDTERSTVGVQPDAYPDPEDHCGPTPVDEKSKTQQHHSNAALDEFVRGKKNFLERHFNSFGTSASTNNQILSQQLDHAKSGDFESTSAMPETASNRNPSIADTLLDKTKRVLDTY